jgi:hypothetical protein
LGPLKRFQRERERERETERETEQASVREIERKSESEEIGRLSEGASERLCARERERERERDLSLGFDDLKRFGSGRDLWFVH